jgi:hypothetical protein
VKRPSMLTVSANRQKKRGTQGGLVNSCDWYGVRYIPHALYLYTYIPPSPHPKIATSGPGILAFNPRLRPFAQ